MHKDLRFLLLLVAVLTVVSGCIFSPKKQDDPPVTTTELPPANTPENLIARFIGVYKQKNTTEYDKLFTGDFLFEFSNSADPDLANEYSAGWFREDERVAAQNLFQGGVNNDGVFQDAAQSINLDLTQKVPQDDNSEGRDPEVYKVLFTPVQLTIQLPPSVDDPEGTTFVVGGADPAVHRFFLVRGDMANGLDENQVADDKHWYIWLWRDESTVTAAPGQLSAQQTDPTPQTTPPSWGRAKGDWR
jgi:hypothetical protein